MRNKRDPKPCACGCGNLVVPKIKSPCGAWSQSKYFSDDCRERMLIKLGKDRRRAKSLNPVHVAPNEKEKMTVHPLLDKYLTGRLA